MALQLNQPGARPSAIGRSCRKALKPMCQAIPERWGAPATSIGRVLLAGVASAIICTSGAAPSRAEPGAVIAGPARVVDGDTLVINGERIRLYGVDAPESAQQCSDARGAPYPCGLASKDALAKKIGSAPVRCDVKNSDQYGRNVAVCGLQSAGPFGGGLEDLNGWLVSNGHAVAYRQYGKEYVALEDAAHAASKGIWAGQFQVPSEWRKANKRGEAGPVQAAVAFVPNPAAVGAKGGDPVPSCATGPAIKGNISSSGERIYHAPGGRYYESVRIDLKDGERFFCTETEATAAGWRRSAQARAAGASFVEPEGESRDEALVSLPTPLVYPWHSISLDAEPAPGLSPLRAILTSSLAHPSLVALLKHAAACAAAEGNATGDQGPAAGVLFTSQDLQQDSSTALEARHLLAALLLDPRRCPALSAALERSSFPAADAAAQLLGGTQPPRRTQPLAADCRRPQPGAGNSSSSSVGAESGETGLEASMISTCRSLDTALEDLDARQADLEACGFAASAACQLLLLQAYRWAMHTGASTVHPAHVAHAMLVQACFSRFRTGFATDPPAQAALELYALLPGLVCHQALAAVQAEMRSLATASPRDGGPRPDAAGGNEAEPSASAERQQPQSGQPARAPAAAAAAADLLHRYGRIGLLTSRSALTAIAASLEGAAEPSASTWDASGEPRPVAAGANVTVAVDSLPRAPLPQPSYASGGTAAPAEVRVLCACAALGYQLPLRALGALMLVSGTDDASAPQPSWAAPPLSGGEPASDPRSEPRYAAPSEAAAAANATAWLTPRVLSEWLEALAFHGAAPRSLASPSSGAAPSSRQQRTAADSGGAADGVAPGSAVDVAPASSPAPNAPRAFDQGRARQPCHSWLERAVLRCLASATAWELPALAPRLAAMAAVDPGWARCAARATELGCRACLHITPLWNGNRIYNDLLLLADAILAMADVAVAATAAATTTTTVVPEGRPTASAASSRAAVAPSDGSGGGRDNSGWLAAWAAAELPYQAERWGRKLVARVHKGPGAGLLDPLPREPEWPTFEQAGGLLLRAVRLAAAARQLGGVGVRQDRDQQENRAQRVQEQRPLLLHRGLVVNLLAVLQAQLRTCSAGPAQLEAARLGLQELVASEQHQHNNRRDRQPGQQHQHDGQQAARAVGGAAALDGSASGGGEGTALRRHTRWLRAAQEAYTTPASGPGPADGSGQATPAGDAAAAADDAAAAEAVLALLPSLVLGQTYRVWQPDVQPPVAVALHDAYRRAAAPRTATAGEPVEARGGGQACAAAAAAVARRCLARLHYPLPLQGLEQGADSGGKGGAPQAAEPSLSSVYTGLAAMLGGAAGAMAVPAHVPFEGAGLRAGGGGSGSAAPGQRAGPARPPPAAARARLQVARDYPPTRNLPALPPPSEELLLRLLDGGGATWALLDGATAGQLVGLLVSRVAPVGAPAATAAAALMPAAASSAAGGGGAATAPAATTPIASTGMASSAAPATPLSPVGAQPRELRLPDGALVAVAAALVAGCAPDALASEELWALHVADRDAGLGRRLRGARALEAVSALIAAPEAASGTGPPRELAEAWEAWLDAARDAQLAAAPESSTVAARELDTTSASADMTTAARPPVSVPDNIPRTAPRPSLPPVCRLELLLLRRRYGPVQVLLALLWQGSWFRGDAASMARLSGGELLYVMCALVHLKELEELEGAELGWLDGEAAAAQCLQLLAAPAMPQLLAHPAAAWGVGPAGPYSPNDLAQEKRTRCQKLLDAAVGVDECFARAAQALAFVAASGGPSGVLGGGRLDPYRPLGMQGEGVQAFEGHVWLAGAGAGGVGEGGGAGGASAEREGAGSAEEGGGGAGPREEGRSELRVGVAGGDLRKGAEEGVSIRGLRARREPAASAKADVVGRWEALLGGEGVGRLRSALSAMGYDPDRRRGGRSQDCSTLNPLSMLLAALNGFVRDHPEREAEDIEQEVLQTFTSILEERDKSKAGKSPSIPLFYRPKAKNELGPLVQREAKRRHIQETLLLSEDELRQIWYMMEELGTYTENGEEVRINYDGFSQVLTRCRDGFGPQIDAFFKAAVFLKFERDANGCISANQFLNYLNLRTTMHQNRLELSAFDPDNTGSLTTDQLEAYVKSLLPQVPALSDMQPSFLEHYGRIAVRKLLFFHGKNGSVRIRDLVNSIVLQELNELKNNQLQEHQLISNWFSFQSTQRVYKTFLALDEDMNGLLSRAEFSAISNGTMSPLFISRIFEEHVMRVRVVQGRKVHRDEMDLLAFTDFVLAWDHRSHAAAIKYFFDIFDLKKQGYVSAAELYIFFKEIHHMWVNVMHEYADLAIYDVVDEILDMVKPKQTARISPDDLAASGMSGIFFSMLSDVKQFYDYNYRENLMHQDDDSAKSLRCRAAAATSSRRRSVRVECMMSPKAQQQLRTAAACFMASATLAVSPAFAGLNAFEEATTGEFGMGSAQQWGEADIQGKDFSGQDLRRSNFTSADARNANFKGANLQGAYFIKAVTFRANFEEANLSDVLMDRATMVEANLRNAVLQRAVFTRSDLKDAVIEGADFTNALLDKTQVMALCKYADGTNSITGVKTRSSLGCGGKRRYQASYPSNPDGPQVAEDEKEAFRKTLYVYGQ
ncbi:Serine/threonine-protein phosphatase 2A regulatory subunit B'' subunit gamma [Tetrabaena socialis]|uniref:Serine/threonine-protein phosphatase 2A regulatory subunit B'' subunit gamma n=1 Tax=Tetrabaena socialis TaxID=47790 RepID=A0A2J8AGD3_9CHLO|nr:Serine/threonine-protein phosphatase 2A regulatory subunit B'' subunit gamma [Tetrabaena socialis]|eukprot:PNH11580.1 Serine/threonine-protein phosphatase 2A regulatory subunit B'' subunit gamma [Tetrabaena socialis]